ncbi:multicopper oxidase domain-containing protein [Arthrobacter sp. L77]|uniref:multicopper oxidase domain-containing protein n=1 Tax=Arthrobacter sp. L77 TaxID=1496689 RepID=UPI000AB760BA|nr:multicopper oxidase domain-containing protein [Arthrobacter sp. L77]
MSIFSRRRIGPRSVRAVGKTQESAERKRQEEARKRADAERRSEDRDRAAPTRKPSPTPKPTTQKPSPTPRPTTVKPSPTPTATPPRSPSPTPTATASPTATPSVTSAPQVPPVGTPEEMLEHRFRSQVDFSSDQLEVSNPVTEFRQTPALAVQLDVHKRELRMDDGAVFEMWSFEDQTYERGFPGPTLRLQEGKVFHGTVHPSMGPHTIHWHGMEPDPRNDGVGHTSFEVDGQYTYQFQPEPGRPGDPNNGAAGTYFYHCHVNTPLHAQMGMFGPLVVDPVVHPDYPVSPGARRAFTDGPEYDIDTEAVVAPYSLDPRWHRMGHAEGLSGEDAGLNRFEPKHFYLLGGEMVRRPKGKERVWSLSRLRANVEGGPRKPTLLRTINANYLPNLMTFTDAEGTEVRIAELISHDGRPYRDTSAAGAPSPSSRDAGHPLITSRLAYGAAERFDMLLHPPAPGLYYLRVEWQDWITGNVLGTRTIPITAS